MYPVSEAFLQAVQENTRRYYWTGRITTKAGIVHEFSEKYIINRIGTSMPGFENPVDYGFHFYFVNRF